MLTTRRPRPIGPPLQKGRIPNLRVRNPPAPLEPGAPDIGPLHVIAALWAGLLVWWCTGPVNDVDSYWHVLIGREILHRHTLDGLGTSWLGVPSPPWRTSQWLAEVGMAQLVDHGGWRALIVVRLLLAIGTVSVVARTLFPRRDPRLAVPVFVATTFGLVSIVQDRPQTVSVFGLALVAAASTRLLLEGRAPRWPWAAAGCLLWAQFHPLWILAPVAFALVALAALVDGPAGRDRVRPALVSATACLTGVLSPQGLTTFLLPFRFKAATGLILEWKPTNLNAGFTLAWAFVILVTVVAWARAPHSVPRGEVLWALLWWGFGAYAVRNVIPSALFTAPLAVAAAQRTWGEALACRLRPTGPREARALRAACVVAVLPGLLLSATLLSRLDPLRDVPARRIASSLAAMPGPVRVFNAYVTSGALASFGGGNARLVIDGRADLWGGAYLRRIQDTQELRGSWQQVLDDFHPDACVLPADTPLAVLLQRDPGWRVAVRDESYVLLLRNG